MKFSLDILFALVKDFLIAQDEKDLAEKVGELIVGNEKDLLEIRKTVKLTDMLKAFFKSNPAYMLVKI